MYFPLPCVQHQCARVTFPGDALGKIQQVNETLTTEGGKQEAGLQLQAVGAPHFSTEFRNLLTLKKNYKDAFINTYSL